MVRGVGLAQECEEGDARAAPLHSNPTTASGSLARLHALAQLQNCVAAAAAAAAEKDKEKAAQFQAPIIDEQHESLPIEMRGVPECTPRRPMQHAAREREYAC